jgi:hypothetical protein
MSMLSDYIRHVVDPMEASYRATVESQRRRIADLEASLNAVRAEERAKAVEVVRPFASVEAMSGRAPQSPVGVLRSVTSRHMSTWSTGGLNAGHFQAAAAYISDNEGGA